MPRGISGTISTALDATTISGLFYLVRISLAGQTLYYGERGGITYDGDAYTARVLNISSLDFTPSAENKVSIQLANVDGALTAIDQVTGFAGAKVEIIEYIDSISDGYVKFAGISDELTEINQKTATLNIYGGTSNVSTEIPKRVISINCNWEFANTSQYISSLEFEGSECPYNRVSTIGFRALIDPGSSIDGTTDPVTFVLVWDATAYAAGARFVSGDQCLIGTERLFVTTASAPNGSRQQTITAVRGYNDTTIAAHIAGDTVYYGSCPFSVDGCKARGMYGNNPNDQASGVNRNYFGGIPQITESTKEGSSPLIKTLLAKKGLTFSGNDSAYNSPLPLVYGKVQIRDPKPIIVKSENDFLSVVCLVAEGPLATNSTDDAQTTTVDAYSTDSLGTVIEINGARRHDPRPGYGIQVQNGTMDQPTIIPNFLNSVTDFTTYKLGYNGTAWFALRIDTKNNPSVDVKAGDVNALAQIEYGRVVRVYSDTSTYARKATHSPSWVMLDMLTAKRGGGGEDFSDCNVQSFIDVADYCAQTVSSVVDGSSVSRWTFNGAIDTKKSLSEWLDLVALGAYTLPPFRDSDNKWKIKSLKAESLGSVPFFSSNTAVTADRNILWDGPTGGSTLTKSRKPFADIPNEIRVTFIDSTDFAKVTLVIADREAQRKIGKVLGNNAITVLSKSVDLPGTSTLDEAARIGTLILRAGMFGEGGLANNLKINFKTSYRTAADQEVGDVIEVNDDLLDPLEERYFRITNIRDSQISVTGGGLLFSREIEAVLHTNEIYDDTAVTVTDFSRISPPLASNMQPPPVTGFSVTEVGIFDNNGKPTTRLTINYTEPSPLDNYRSLILMRSSDDGIGGAVGDWRIIGEVFYDGAQIQYEVSGEYQHFAAVSRPLSGHIPSVDTQDAAGAFVYPRVRILVDGKADSLLPAPTGLAAFGRNDYIALKWDAYTGTDKQFFKRFNVYRGTTSDPDLSSLVGETDTNWFNDTDAVIKDNPTTVYYYFLKGVSVVENSVIDGVTLDGLSNFSSEAHDNVGADTGVPSPAPVLGVVSSLASASDTEFVFTIGIEKPGSPVNYDTVESWDLQISTDVTFATFPDANCLDQTLSRRIPDVYLHYVNLPGTYYIRARANNILGSSAWSTTLTIVTASSGLAADSDLADPPIVIATTNGGNANIGGNIVRVDWTVPQVNTSSLWGFNLMLHTSSTLPTNTTSDTGSSGVLVGGVNRLTDVTKSWTPSQWVTGNSYAVIIFSPYRQATPSWDNEGMWIWGIISGNGADYLDFDIGGTTNFYVGSGLKYYIIRRDNNDSLFTKCIYHSANEVDPQIRGAITQGALRTKDIPIATTSSIYAFVALNTVFAGGGKLGTSGAATIGGFNTASYGALSVTTIKVAALAITETKIDSDAISTPKLQALAVVAAKIDVSQLSAISSDFGTITAGTVTGVTIQTAVSGQRVVLNSSGLSAYNSSGTIKTKIGIDLGGYMTTDQLYGLTNNLAIGSGFSGAQSLIAMTSTSIGFQINGVQYATLVAGDWQISGDIDATGTFYGDGSGITGIDASSIASGTLSASRLPTSVVQYGGSAVAGNINVSSGYGMASGGTSFACSSNAEIYQSSTLVASISTSGTQINIGGVLKTLSVDGSGFVKAS